MRIVGRYFEETWQEVILKCPDATLRDAHDRASELARTLDEKYGNSHFWTVNIYSDNNPTSSMYELFHGRLS